MPIGRLVSRARILTQGRLRSYDLAAVLVQGKSGIEIGGPSNVFHDWFRPLPIYSRVGALDNCDFSQSTVWAEHRAVFNFKKGKAPGQVYFCEGSDLGAVRPSRYDFLLSSHNLEHFANPIKALKEWQRVVRPDGHFIIVLPHYAKTFDKRRKPTVVSHMLEDFANNTQEDDLSHVEEVFQAHRLNPGQMPDDDLRALLMDNFSHRMIHHHCFDETNSRELLEAAGMKVLALETAFPFHIF